MPCQSVGKISLLCCEPCAHLACPSHISSASPLRSLKHFRHEQGHSMHKERRTCPLPGFSIAILRRSGLVRVSHNSAMLSLRSHCPFGWASSRMTPLMSPLWRQPKSFRPSSLVHLLAPVPIVGIHAPR